MKKLDKVKAEFIGLSKKERLAFLKMAMPICDIHVDRLEAEKAELIAFIESLQLDVSGEVRAEELIGRVKGE